ncbi:MAG: S8 family serine peptidase [Lachnospiraceae bacterium]|nr:S8 family serine peptidase [Lachnospiraceae bacterium]
MASQKLENLLNLALSAGENERLASMQLNVGFSEESRKWELIVKYNGDLGRLNNELIQIEELIAGYAIVTIPENLIQAFAELDEVEYVEKPKRLYFSTLQGKQASCIPPVTAREPFLTGRDVLIGVIDSGIDYKNSEFINTAGSRIQYLWDQTLTPAAVNARLGQTEGEVQSEFAGRAAAPAGFSTGVEFGKARIDAALNSANPDSLVPSFDTSGHGTAVAAIAAAGGNLQDGRFKGVAPESELIVVKLGSPAPDSFPRTTELMRALTYVVRKAVELGRPVAINLSFGNTYGSHDGTSLVERFLDNIAEIGRTVICVGSGNEGAAGGHVSGNLLQGRGNALGGPVLAGQPTAGQLVPGQFTPGRFPPEQIVGRVELNIGSYQPSVSVQLWKEYVDRFQIALISPAGIRQEIDSLRTGMQTHIMEQTKILLYIGEPSPYSVNQEIYFDFLPLQSYVNAGIWTFELAPISIVSGNYDFYLPSNTVLNAATRFFTPTPDKTLTIPSTAAKVITVGAYDAGYESYADFSGRGYPLQSIAGERVNQGSIKPDIAAPGVAINTVGPDNTLVQVSGTSFAVPFATGSAALLMEWGIVRGNDPYLYGEKVKAYFRRGARPVRGESVYPNERVGYGALCVAESIPI